MKTPVSFSYPSVAKPGGMIDFKQIETFDPSPEVLSEMRGLGIPFSEIKLYRGASPGPRFCQIDGVFFRLNGKSKRSLSFVTSNAGYSSVHDVFSDSCPLRDHPTVILKLIREMDA